MNSTAVLLFESVFGTKISEFIQSARWIKRLKQGRDHEHEIQLFRDYLNQGETAVDVGAYGAGYTYAMSKSVGAKGSVFVFEPLPKYARVLDNVLRKLDCENVRLVRAALQNRTEEVSLTYATSSGRSLVGEVHVTSITDSGQSVIVEGTTLDEFAAENMVTESITEIKVDIEGGELSMLQGSLNVLTQSTPLVLCEIEKRHCVRYGYEPSDIFLYMANLGYEAYSYLGLRKSTQPPIAATNNVIFCHHTRTATLHKRIGLDKFQITSAKDHTQTNR